jgi:NAD+ kinase
MATNNKPFKRICLFSQYIGDDYHNFFAATLTKLSKIVTEICVIEDFALNWPNCPYPAISERELSSGCDIIIVLGGDGTMLRAAHLATPRNIPILGINRGKLGFLADLKPADWQTLTSIIQGKYLIEKRKLLNITTPTHPHLNQIALNDIAITRGSETHLLEFQVMIDDLPIYSQRADGLIIATPTGSTAYALSAGGPILHPQVGGLVMLPICPHHLTSRPLVLPDHNNIKVSIPAQRLNHFALSCDGGNSSENMLPGEFIISTASKSLKLIHPTNYHYYETLRSKLHWEKTS